MNLDLHGSEPVGDTLPDGSSIASDLMLEARRLYERKEYAQAATVAGRAIASDPTDPDHWNTRGVFLRAGGRSAEAVWDYRQALARDSANSGTWSNLGNALADVKQLDTAILCHNHAVSLSPDNPELYRNLARVFLLANRHRDALDCLSKALRLDPGNIGSKFDRGMVNLHLGEYAHGWQDYEVRLINNTRRLPGKLWNGQPYAGSRLVVVAEQGHGDAIWSARYLPQVKALGGELVVECHDALVPLFSTMPHIDQVVPLEAGFPVADYHIHSCSLARLFTPDPKSIRGEPYIVPPADRAGKFAEVMARAGNALKVGIVWSGNLAFLRNRDRAAPLQAFMQAFAHPGVQLYSLQKGPLEKDLAALAKGAPIIDLAPYLDDFADSAAAIAQLDLVIMTDSAIAHLSGALGKPVWVLLSYEAFWLWLDRPDSPWYASMRLFRQRAWGDWGGAFDAASAALLQLVLERTAAASRAAQAAE